MNIPWNQVLYVDNMNTTDGLPSLPDQSIELCLTDPPYGVNYKGGHENKDVNYTDELLPFDWLEEVLRICKGIIFTPGMNAMYKYIKYKEPKNLLRFAYYPSNGKRCHVDPILTYGTITRLTHMRDIKEFPHQKYEGFLHPSPKSRYLWEYILKKLKPKSVLDCFMGSGTTAEVCTKFGIKWVGYELNPIYKQDIDKRLRYCKKEPQQISLEVF